MPVTRARSTDATMVRAGALDPARVADRPIRADDRVAIAVAVILRVTAAARIAGRIAAGVTRRFACNASVVGACALVAAGVTPHPICTLDDEACPVVEVGDAGMCVAECCFRNRRARAGCARPSGDRAFVGAGGVDLE